MRHPHDFWLRSKAWAERRAAVRRHRLELAQKAAWQDAHDKWLQTMNDNMQSYDAARNDHRHRAAFVWRNDTAGCVE